MSTSHAFPEGYVPDDDDLAALADTDSPQHDPHPAPASAASEDAATAAAQEEPLTDRDDDLPRENPAPDEDWQHKYQSLKGRYEPLAAEKQRVEELAQMHAQRAENLLRQGAEFKTQFEAAHERAAQLQAQLQELQRPRPKFDHLRDALTQEQIDELDAFVRSQTQGAATQAQVTQVFEDRMKAFEAQRINEVKAHQAQAFRDVLNDPERGVPKLVQYLDDPAFEQWEREHPYRPGQSMLQVIESSDVRGMGLLRKVVDDFEASRKGLHQLVNAPSQGRATSGQATTVDPSLPKTEEDLEDQLALLAQKGIKGMAQGQQLIDAFYAARR